MSIFTYSVDIFFTFSDLFTYSGIFIFEGATYVVEVANRFQAGLDPGLTGLVRDEIANDGLIWTDVVHTGLRQCPVAMFASWMRDERHTHPGHTAPYFGVANSIYVLFLDVNLMKNSWKVWKFKVNSEYQT